MIKEITVFTDGDSTKLSTWSNVPFFFTETLIAKGIKVNRVNIGTNPNWERKYDKTINRIVIRILKKTSYGYFRSYTNFINVRYRIWKAVKRYPNSDVFIFLTFSFSSVGFTKKPIVLFCDWTYDHYIRHHLNRNPDFLERQCIKREDSQINKSDLVLTLFPKVEEYMKKRYKCENISYLGNVINSLFTASSDIEVLEKKKEKKKILFVGSPKYIEGAKVLLQAYTLLKKQYPSISLHFVGIEASLLENLPSDVYCYGYLNKGNDSERELYYQLLNEATIFVNTTPLWGAFSASIEAMYFYTPVIVSPYDEFVETFGSKINVGLFCERNSPDLLAEKIEALLFHKDYVQICQNAHNAVEEFTWDSYIDKVMDQVKKLEGLKGDIQ